MNTHLKHSSYLKIARVAFLPLAISLFLGGCWSKEEPSVPTPQVFAPEPAPQARAATPTSPMPSVLVQTPTSPLSAPNAVSLAELTGKANPLSLDNMNRVHVGMTFDQVNRSLGKDGVIFSSGNVNSEICRWSDDSGASIVAKFESGKLVRKTIIPPESATPKVEESADTLLSKAQYEKVQTGMMLNEIQAMLGVEPRVISDHSANVIMVEWVDKKGSNFFARFDNGRMTRKTGFHVKTIKEETENEEAAESGGGAPAKEDNYQEEKPQESAPENVIALAGETVESNYELIEEVPAPFPPRRKVAVVGGSREKEERSYYPQAKFPEYTWQFRSGNYEVRVKNTADTEVKVGLRAGKYGKDVSIAPGRSASIEVEQGTYTFYYKYGDEPDNVYTGQSFNIDGMTVADVEVQVFNEDYGIGNLNRAYD